MYKESIRFLHNNYFKLFKINNFQSFKYQVMICIMHLHQLKRLNLLEEFGYIGTDTLYLTKEDWNYTCSVILKTVSSHNKKSVFKGYSKEEISGFIYSLFFEENKEKNSNDYSDITLSKNKYFEVKISEEEDYFLEITMTDFGYSYQYNGYKRSDVKSQEKTNYFAIATLFGTTFAWLENKSMINLKDDWFYIISVYSLIFLIYTLRKKRWLWNIILGTIILGLIIA